MKHKFIHSALATVLFAGATICSAATVVFDNTSSHPGGTLTFGTSAGSTAGLANGVIDLVTRIDGSVASFPVTSSAGFNCGSPTSGFGCLNFTTGTFLDQATSGSTTTYRYNSGGTLTINGTADGAVGLLFSSTGFDGIVTLNVDNTTGLSSLSGTLKAGTVNSVLATTLGISPNTPGGTSTNSAISVVVTAGAGTGSATTNSVQITAAAVPEPASMVLIGTGLSALAFVARRRRSA